MANSANSSGISAKRAEATQQKAASPEPAMNLDLNTLDRASLLQLDKDVERALRSYKRRRRDEALREMQMVAEKRGFSLKDLMGSTSSRNLQARKYPHLENPALPWSGRGRQPDWLKEALDAGASRVNMLIA